MATTSKLVKSISRSLSSRRSLHLTTRHLSSFSSSSPSITEPPPIPTVRLHPSSPQTLANLFRHSQLPNPNGLASRFSSTRLCVNEAGNLPPGSDRSPADMARLFPGCDYKHWLIITDKPGDDSTSKQQTIDFYIQTLAKVIGSEEEAKKKIYSVSCERYFGFGCELEEEIAKKLEDLPGVLFVLPDSYVDPENKDYGAELFVNGEIVQRPPERQRRVEIVPQKDRAKPGGQRSKRRV